MESPVHTGRCQHQCTASEYVLLRRAHTHGGNLNPRGRAARRCGRRGCSSLGSFGSFGCGSARGALRERGHQLPHLDVISLRHLFAWGPCPRQRRDEAHVVPDNPKRGWLGIRALMLSMTPAAGARTSMVTLSVSIWAITSSTATASPAGGAQSWRAACSPGVQRERTGLLQHYRNCAFGHGLAHGRHGDVAAAARRVSWRGKSAPGISHSPVGTAAQRRRAGVAVRRAGGEGTRCPRLQRPARAARRVRLLVALRQLRD